MTRWTSCRESSQGRADARLRQRLLRYFPVARYLRRDRGAPSRMTGGRLCRTRCWRRCSSPTSSARPSAPRELGDRAWRELLERHHAAGPARAGAASGVVSVDTAGDGFFATLRRPGARDPVRARDPDAVGALGLEIRAGVHTGECELIGESWPGSPSTPVPASRRRRGRARCSCPAPSRTSSPAPGIEFEDRGEHELKGVGQMAAVRCHRCLIALIIDAVRTPIGKKNGTLSTIRGDELAGQVLNGLVARTTSIPARSRTSRWAASPRSASRPGTSAGWCRSWPAGRRPWPAPRRPAVRLVDADQLQRGGCDPGGPARRGRLRRCGDDVARPDGLERRRPLGEADERWEIVPQGISAEVIADEWNLSREELDASRSSPTGGRSRRSTRAASRARSCRSRSEPARRHALRGRRDAAAGHVAGEARRARARRSSRTAWSRPAARARSATARRACSSRGAQAAELGLEPRARFVSFGLAGVDPYRMLHGNPQACERALAKAGLRLGRHVGDRGQRGVRVGRAPVPRATRASRSAWTT